MTSDVDLSAHPSSEESEDQVFRWARERAEMIQGLYIHLIVFTVINGGLFLINAMTRGEGGSWWFLWPLLIWGLGLMVHVLATVAPVFSPQWVDRRAQRIAAKYRGR